ncbi:MAG TPA: RidA family protein [Saprospiraceae bacterium]|nr:RidA family protein [Saprospiraceae bacterium]
MENKMEHINPDGLIKNPAFSQIITTEGNGKTIYIGGQNAVNEKREIVGKGDILKQTEQVMKNLEIALQSCGANFENLVKLNIHIVQGQNAYGAFQVSQKYLSQNSKPPVITVLYVAGLINPDFLLEIDAIAFLPKN